jgi:hypothetical protein
MNCGSLRGTKIKGRPEFTRTFGLDIWPGYLLFGGLIPVISLKISLLWINRFNSATGLLGTFIKFCPSGPI